MRRVYRAVAGQWHAICLIPTEWEQNHNTLKPRSSLSGEHCCFQVETAIRHTLCKRRLSATIGELQPAGRVLLPIRKPAGAFSGPLLFDSGPQSTGNP